MESTKYIEKERDGWHSMELGNMVYFKARI